MSSAAKALGASSILLSIVVVTLGWNLTLASKRIADLESDIRMREKLEDPVERDVHSNFSVGDLLPKGHHAYAIADMRIEPINPRFEDILSQWFDRGPSNTANQTILVFDLVPSGMDDTTVLQGLQSFSYLLEDETIVDIDSLRLHN